MRHNSEISTIARGTGNGGNIEIVDADSIIAVPSEDSDIVANAFEGNGGNINITTQGIFGLEFRDELTPESDITASSEFGVNGTVEINTPDFNPAQGLAALPVELVDASRQIATSCAAVGDNKFVITGRGGLPPSPNEVLSSDAVWVDWGTLNPKVENSSSPAVSTNPTAPEPAPIVEARGWVINGKGEVMLTASAPTVTPDIPWLPSANCRTSQASS
jgi:large exoprotein involved in heme utilization and adhesion